MWDKSKRSMYIELSSICNFDCIFCGSSYRKDIGFMDRDLFTLALNQTIHASIDSIRLSPMTGELFLNRKWKECFNEIEDHEDIRQFGFFTNLSACKPKDIFAFLNYSKLKDISISLYGHDFRTFKLLTNGNMLHYDRITSNLQIMSKMATLFHHVTIYLKTTIDVDISKIKYLKDLKVTQFRELDTFMGYSKDLDFAALKTSNKKINCEVLNKKNIVLWNGDFNLCGCRDIDQLSTIGNIKDKTIKEMMASDEYGEMLKSKDVCKDCNGILV